MRGIAQAGTYTVVHVFTGQQDGDESFAALATDPGGNMYGVTQYGGVRPSDYGALFKIDLAGNSTVLHCFDCATGCGESLNPLTFVQHGPQGAPLLYGTTYTGGAGYNGVVFSINPDGSNYTVLHAFNDVINQDGIRPIGPLQPIAGRGVVGLTEYGGTVSQPNTTPGGVLYSINQSGRFRILHSFGRTGDGSDPNYVVADRNGHVFGSTASGSSCGRDKCGVIFEYDLNKDKYSIIYRFTGGANPVTSILGSIGPDGTLYGAANYNSSSQNYGEIFSLTPSGGSYVFQTLAEADARTGYLYSGPTLTPAGRLIGVAYSALYVYNGGKSKILQRFVTSQTGEDAMGQPVLAPDGSIVGTTLLGGEVCNPIAGFKSDYGCGLVYRYAP